jgi:hypothetical protein
VDVGLLGVEELGQVLSRPEKRRAGVFGIGSLSTDELALAPQRQTVSIERRQALLQAHSLGIEIAPGLIEDRHREGVVPDQVAVEIELIRKAKQLEIADPNGAPDDRIAGLELQETFARGVRRRSRPGSSGLVVEAHRIACEPGDDPPDRDHPGIFVEPAMLMNRAQLGF